MVLYYGLFALETANNTIAASTSISEREKKSKAERRSMTSSSNSWIYTEDLKKRFEQRYGDYRYIFIPIYVDKKNVRYYSNSTLVISRKSNSWIYSQSIRQYVSNSLSTICVNNPAFIRDEIPRTKKFFSRNEILEEENHFKPFLQHSSVMSSNDNNIKQNTNKKLTRLRSFFFKSFSS